MPNRSKAKNKRKVKLPSARNQVRGHHGPHTTNPLPVKRRRGRPRRKKLTKAERREERRLEAEAKQFTERMEKHLRTASVQPLKENLTGGQIQEVLDALILESIKPIVYGTDVFSLEISYILAVTARNKKRKLSALPREESIDKMCQYLVTDDVEKRAELLSTMKLERGFIYNFVVKLLRDCEDYIALYQSYLVEHDDEKREILDRRLQAIERSIGCTRESLFPIINTSGDYLAVTYEFRNSIVMNYLKHAFKQARSFVKMKRANGANFDFEDVYQNFLTAITKAVDKYDSSKGALTSYINYWVLNAQTTSNSAHGHEYGVAYSIPQLQRRALAEKSSKAMHGTNFGVSLDHRKGTGDEEAGSLYETIAAEGLLEEDMMKEQELNDIRLLAKKADPRGLARLYLDIEEVYTKREKKQMLKTMRRQLGLIPRVKEGVLQFVMKTVELVSQPNKPKRQGE